MLTTGTLTQYAIAQLPGAIVQARLLHVGLPPGPPRKVKIEKRKTWKEIEAAVAEDSMVESTVSQPWALLGKWANEQKLRQQQPQAATPTSPVFGRPQVQFGNANMAMPMAGLPQAPKSKMEMMLERFRGTNMPGPTLEEVLMRYRKGKS